jgi:uncharacterized repeat protein (TIGR03803 family)
MTKMNKYQIAIALLAILVMAAALPAYAQTFTQLYNFGTKSGDALNPQGAVAQGLDGDFYSTSSSGGANNWGSVFKVTPDGTERVLYSFCSQKNCTDGNTPHGGLTLRPDGHFLGTTEFNGVGVANSSGTIFDVSPTGTLATLHTFTGPDGAAPMSPPIEGPDGSFYGVTSSGGGTQNCGTIYRMTGAGFTLLYQFLHPIAEGCTPVGPLVLGSDGSFYGTTKYGGTYEFGTIFRVTLNPGMATRVTVLADVGALNGFSPDYIIQGNDGNFYGITSGDAFSSGTVFKLTPTGTLTTLLISGETQGVTFAGLGQASDGNLYGTASATVEDPYHYLDSLFQVTPAGNGSSVYDFNCNGFVGVCYRAQHPSSPPVQGTNGLLYGSTSGGGTGTGCHGGCGVFYSWDNNLPPFVTTVESMGPVGSSVEVLGQGFNSSTTVAFNGTPAVVHVQSATSLSTKVPAGATTGFLTVITSTGTLTSNKKFIVTP